MPKHSNDDPVLPYPDEDGTMTGGWSGSETSHERAKSEARSGTLQQRQQEVLNMVARKRFAGATWREVSSTLGLHHGQASGALSNLHKGGRVVRLTQKRGKCAVYVYPDYVEGRESAPYGRRKPASPEVGAEVQPARLEPGALADAYQKGRSDGFREGEKRALADLEVFLANLMAATRPPFAQTHSHDCYKKHPTCALKAVHNYATKVGVRV